ncbi:Phosphoglucose isomerase, conserved site-containing protein, partial [Cynara cardunculus var. scolymus]
HTLFQKAPLLNLPSYFPWHKLSLSKTPLVSSISVGSSMASISGLCSSSSSLIPKPHLPSSSSKTQFPWMISFPLRTDETLKTSFSGVSSHSLLTHSVARDVPSSLPKTASTGDELSAGSVANKGLETDPKILWERYTEWLNPKLSPNSFLRLQIENTLEAICAFSEEIVGGKIKPPSSPAGRFTQILSVGIGGSALGPQFVAEALAPDNPPLKIRFIDNTDPAGIDHQIAQLGPELASTLVIVVSKVCIEELSPFSCLFAFKPAAYCLIQNLTQSGGTPETRNGLLEVQKAFREAGLEFAKQGVAITQENSLLDNTARIEGWLARFPMFDWVGGRTSEMSAVGLLAAALQVGIDIKEMLAGASLMDEANRTTVVKNNPAALLALCWYWASDGVGSKDMVVLPYKDSLLLFSRYLQQLVMESLGKEFDLDGNRVNQGLTVYGNKGSTDQHAYIQQLREGVHNFFATFIEVLRDRPPGHDWELEPGVTCGDYLFGMLQGTRSALYANGRESITVTVQEVNPRSVGALIALYERAVGIYASLVNINAYHQPGVEAGKKAAGEVLALQKRVLSVLNEASCKDPVEPLSLEEVADRCHAPEDIEMIYKIIAHMAANDRAIIAEGDCGSPRSVKVFLGECNVDALYD